MGELVVEIIGEIVIDGITYLVSKALNEAGEWIWNLFTDEDGDGVPDDPENPWDSWDHEPEDWLPYPKDDTSEPEESEDVGTIIFMTADGPVVLYSEKGGEEYNDLVSRVTEEWVYTNGAMMKPYHNYTVSEAYLFIIAVGTLVSLFSKIFKRRKM